MSVNTMEYLISKNGAAGGSIMAVVVAIIMLIAVAVPIANDVIVAQNFTGTDSTIANVIPTLLLVGGVVVVTGLY